MPFIPNTPESLLARSDSKNPDGTCRGVTSGGRPCRRPLGASPGASPGSSPQKPQTRVNRLRVDDPSNPDLYCWQHKDQASLSARSSPGPGRGSASGNGPILESRESVDTLIDRLGIVEEQQRKSRQSKKNNNTNNGGRKPSGQEAVRPNEKPNEVSHHQQLSSSHEQKSKKTTITTLFCCCFTIPVVEEEEFEHPQQSQQPQQQQQQQQQQHSELPSRPKPRPVQSAPAATPATAKIPSSAGTSNGGGPKKSSSGQANLLSLIPPNTAPQTASQLLTELAKPPSANDEPGYIYIFWLTPESAGAKPPADAARSLLAPPPPPTSGSHLRPVDQRQRRPSDVLANYAANTSTAKAVTKQQKQGQGRGKEGEKDKKKSGDSSNTLLLKIGRATNVQRRLNEWTRQCGYDIDLIRYYPYVPSNPSSSSSSSRPSTSSASKRPSTAAAAAEADGPRKTPHSHKVERLVHIELSGLGMRALDDGACAACGRAHREWFEVDASRRGIGVVDEIIKRWCDWDEGRL